MSVSSNSIEGFLNFALKNRKQEVLSHYDEGDGLVGMSMVKVFLKAYYRVPTSSGNHGKPGKSRKKVPCMEKSWNLKNPE